MLICLNVLLIFMIGRLNIVSSLFIDGMCVVAFAHVTNTMSGATFHSLVMMLLMSDWCFVGFPIKGLCTRFVITICKFYKLYGELWCKGLWWRVIIQMANDA